MQLLMNIEAATIEGRAISGLYAKLRATRGGAERAAILRQIGDCADALGKRLRQLAEQQARNAADETVRAALSKLSDAMEQVMVQEREYRLACGAPLDPQDVAPEKDRS